MKATVLFGHTDNFDEFKQQFEEDWGKERSHEAFKLFLKVLDIRLRRAVKNFTDDDIRDLWDEFKACDDYLMEGGRIFEHPDFKLPLKDIYLSLFDDISVLSEIDTLALDDFAILFELGNGSKILLTMGDRKNFTDDDTIECTEWNAR
ncbi:MAG: hypothetical protein IJM64_08675 [Ottowia sp.]|nr:hypothetical protein [Ottowia sp.]